MRRTLIKFIANKTGGAHCDPKDTDTVEATLSSLMDGKMQRVRSAILLRVALHREGDRDLERYQQSAPEDQRRTRLARPSQPRLIVMQFSGHKTDSMLKRYHVINVDDLRQAALRGAAYSGQSASIVPMRAAGENPERSW